MKKAPTQVELTKHNSEAIRQAIASGVRGHQASPSSAIHSDSGSIAGSTHSSSHNLLLHHAQQPSSSTLSPVARTRIATGDGEQPQQQQQQGTPTPSFRSSTSYQSSATAMLQGTFSASDAAKHLNQEHVARLSQDMFRKLIEYIRAEMLATGEDYKVLEAMNNLTKDRYGEMAGMAQDLMQEVGKLRTTYSDFEPYVAKIDTISQQADMIAKVVAELDEYTRDLDRR
ncbi:biogenesis of lysosome- organelles complex 1 subunit 2 [Actinomortierella ambigua]|uniref:Biogenesis of lysosome- organelles complex 1 subunit 2 n=1 Tax=Actinomortierella ambigua TaxID=1343610 RepID=A0A9P6Q1T4_9FUNG|nr:biogenesis of lysosome- organelles complex 1 subunit 2 [Actinomortierella ambigua]